MDEDRARALIIPRHVSRRENPCLFFVHQSRRETKHTADGYFISLTYTTIAVPPSGTSLHRSGRRETMSHRNEVTSIVKRSVNHARRLSKSLMNVRVCKPVILATIEYREQVTQTASKKYIPADKCLHCH